MKIKWLYFAMLACVLWLLFLSLSPVASRDALIHHMALPKLWLERGIFAVDTYRTYAFYPSNIQALYQGTIFYGIEFLPKIIHSAFLCLTGFLVYGYLKHVGTRTPLACLAFLLVLTIPICQRLATEAYVDLGFLFFSTLSLIYFLSWKHTHFQTKKCFYISAIAAGLALGTKYNGLLILAILSSLCGYTYGRYTKQRTRALVYSGQFLAIALLLASPWLIRNYIASGGNPFYPLLSSIFSDTIDQTKPLYPVLNHTMLYRMIEGESIADILLLPFRIFFDGEDHNFLRFDGKLNPMMLMLMPFAFLFRRGGEPATQRVGSSETIERQPTKPISDKWMLLIFVIAVILCSFSRDIRIRYLIPIIPPIVILNIRSIEAMLDRKTLWLSYAVYGAIGFYLAYNAVYGYKLLQHVDHTRYVVGRETKADYLNRKIAMYPIYDYINTSTDKQAVIYDVMGGHRSYYVDREYLHHPSHVDTVFMNYLSQSKGYADYEAYLQGLKTYSGAQVTHLLIRPYLLIDAYKRIFPKSDRGAMRSFLQFLNRHKMVLQAGDARLYELVRP